MSETMRSRFLLEVKDLQVTFPTPGGDLHAVNGISYGVRQGEVMGIVGESGSGKSAAAYAVMRLLRAPGRITGGSITFGGKDVLEMDRRELSAFRGKEIGMIFQDPMRCLDPMFSIGEQLTETVLAHETCSKKQARQRSVEMLCAVGIHGPEEILRRYPFELSGGMRQRVLIAMALLCDPKLLIADEPTTALDVTIQDQIIQLLRQLCRERQMAMVFITHNFGIVADLCDCVTVMYGGRVMEQGSVDDVFYAAAHPYTRGLMRAIPKADLLSDERLIPIEGTPIDPLHPPKGCVFGPRCPQCMEICREELPPQTELSAGHTVSCWLCAQQKAQVEHDG